MGSPEDKKREAVRDKEGTQAVIPNPDVLHSIHHLNCKTVYILFPYVRTHVLSIDHKFTPLALSTNEIIHIERYKMQI